MPRSVGHFKMFSGLVADGGSRYRQALDHETHGTISRRSWGGSPRAPGYAHVFRCLIP